MMVVLDCSYSLLPLDVGQELHVLRLLPSGTMAGVQHGLWEEGHFLSCADQDSYQLWLSGVLGPWLDGVPACKSFPLLEGFRCSSGGSPARSPNARPLPCSFSHPRQRSQSLGEGAKFSLTLFQLLRGQLQPLCLLSFGCCWSLTISVIRIVFLVGKQLLFLVVIWRGESPG